MCVCVCVCVCVWVGGWGREDNSKASVELHAWRGLYSRCELIWSGTAVDQRRWFLSVCMYGGAVH